MRIGEPESESSWPGGTAEIVTSLDEIGIKRRRSDRRLCHQTAEKLAQGCLLFWKVQSATALFVNVGS